MSTFASTPDFTMLNDAQRKELGFMLKWVLVQIRTLTRSGQSEQAGDLADMFHNLPHEMWLDIFDLRQFRKSYLNWSVQRHGNQDGTPCDYLGMLDDVDQLADRSPPEKNFAGVEIERKYLVSSNAWKQGAQGVEISQGYLSREPGRTVRVRRYGDRPFLTIKGPLVNLTRTEVEIPISAQDAQALFPLCHFPLIQKTRYAVLYRGHTWEVDEFHGENDGLVVAEIEVPSEDTNFEVPPWAGAEVTHDARYSNSSLSQHPYSQWPKDESPDPLVWYP
jgi:adenylate cyclase